MAARGEELNTRITATDDASKVVDKVAAKVGALEDTPHDIEIDADTAKAEAAAKALDARLEGLTAEEKTVVLAVQARNAQREIDGLNRNLANAAKYDNDEIAIFVEAKGNAERKLDAIQSEIREIDGATPQVEVGVDRSELDNLLADLPGIGGQLSKLGGAGTGAAAAGAGIGALAAGLFLAAENAADTAIAAKNLSTLTGDSVEQASRLSAVWSRTGLDVKDLQDVLLQMGGVLSSNAELTAELGINLNDGRTGSERLVQVTELLAEKYEDAGQRGVIASQLFGEEGVRQVNQVLNIVGDLDEALGEVSDNQVFTQSDFDAAVKYKQEIANLKGEFGGLATAIGQGVVPALTVATGAVGDFVNFSNQQFENAGRTARRAFDTVTFGDFSDERDANEERVRQYEAAEQAAKDFDRTQLDGLKTFDAVHSAVLAATGDVTAANIVSVEWSKSNKDAEQSLLDAADAAGRVSSAADIIAASVDLAASNFRRFGEDGVENMNDVAAATEGRALAAYEIIGREIDLAASNMRRFGDDGVESLGRVEDAAGGVESAVDRLKGQLDEEQAAADLTEQFVRTREAELAAIEARATNSEDATRAQLRYEQELRNLRREVLDYTGDIEDIPEEKRTQIDALLAQGSVEEARRLLEELTEDRLAKVLLDVQAVITQGVKSSSFSFDPTARTVGTDITVNPQPTSQPVSQQNITQNVYALTTSPTRTINNQIQFVDRNANRNSNIR